ncbi:MAG: helix-turn-helix domain-containing protein [Candidatus Bathyarchaeia archaeon]|jgi:predicted transcriptional regulator
MRAIDKDIKEAIIDLFEQGYTEEQIAQELEVSQATVSRVCKGKKRPQKQHPTNTSNHIEYSQKYYDQLYIPAIDNHEIMPRSPMPGSLEHTRLYNNVQKEIIELQILRSKNIQMEKALKHQNQLQKKPIIKKKSNIDILIEKEQNAYLEKEKRRIEQQFGLPKGSIP